jgi:hypothetical protein
MSQLNAAGVIDVNNSNRTTRVAVVGLGNVGATIGICPHAQWARR